MSASFSSLRRFVCRFAVAFAWVGAGAVLAADSSSPVLTRINEIRALSAQRSSEALPVVVRGIVTRLTTYELFLQDGPDAIFVWRERTDLEFQQGDYVEVTGVTDSGQLFPIVRATTIRRLEHRSLPEPQTMRYAELATGHGDSQWVEVTGVVQTIHQKPDGSLLLGLLYDGALLKVELINLKPDQVGRLHGASVRVRGVVNGLKSQQRRLIEPIVCVDVSSAAFWVEQPGPRDVFSLPLSPSTALGGPDGAWSFREMVHVAGVVTCQPSPLLVFVRDGAQSLELRLVQPVQMQMGDKVEAVGFAGMGVIQPVLKNALARRIGPGAPPEPIRLQDAARLLDLRNEAELVQLEGELRDLSRHNDGYVLALTQGGQVFSVELTDRQLAAPGELPPIGSRLSVTGICRIERLAPPDFSQIVAPASVRLLLADNGLKVLSRPSWWTPARLLGLVAVLSLFASVALGWVWTLNRRVQAQTRIILGNARRQATLEERNRIAREFHDTLEQQLAGATILLDAIDTAMAEQPQRARENLQTARAMLRHSLDDAQQAVANLRNNDLFEREFVPLIEDAVAARLAGSGIPVDFRAESTWPELDSRVKQHLLRMVQESVTNAVKHARPGRITVTLRAGAGAIELEVGDDGCGFVVQDRRRPTMSGFGLIGLRERAEKIGAHLTIRSAPREGTTVMVALPLATAFPTP